MRRVEVDVETRGGKTSGNILLPSASTSREPILAADRDHRPYRPLQGTIRVEKIEDTREAPAIGCRPHKNYWPLLTKAPARTRSASQRSAQRRPVAEITSSATPSSPRTHVDSSDSCSCRVVVRRNVRERIRRDMSVIPPGVRPWAHRTDGGSGCCGTW